MGAAIKTTTERERVARAAAKAYCHAIDKGVSCVCGDELEQGCLDDALSWLEAFEAAGCRVERRPVRSGLVTLTDRGPRASSGS